jgi:hypothetical protein
MTKTVNHAEEDVLEDDDNGEEKITQVEED